MTPKQKANSIYDKMVVDFTIDKEQSKLCALVAVQEIIQSEPSYPSNVDWDDCGGTHQYYYEAQREEAIKYWEQVKQEIEKI